MYYIAIPAPVLSVPFLLVLVRFFLKLSRRGFVSNVEVFGKVVIVTGANTGVGFYTAKDLAARGARVILACRNEEKGIMAQNDIIQQTGNSNVVYKNLNLSSFKSVRKFANEVLYTEERLDVLINNAGIFGLGNVLTEDGIVEGMQVNHYSPFLLTILLLPLLKKSQPSRIVNVNSNIHYLGLFGTDKLNKKGYYGTVRTYSNSKLCSLIVTMELAKRLQGTGVVVNALHPGIIETNLFGKTSAIARFGFKIWCWICCKTAEEGSHTSLYLAVAEETERINGKYFVDCKPQFTIWTFWNMGLAQKLWKISTEMTGCQDVNL